MANKKLFYSSHSHQRYYIIVRVCDRDSRVGMGQVVDKAEFTVK